MKNNSLIHQPRFEAKALLIADKINLRDLSHLGEILDKTPPTLKIGEEAIVVVFRFGVVVFFNTPEALQQHCIETLNPQILGPQKEIERESIQIEIDPAETEEGSFEGTIFIRQATYGHLQTIADVLAKSVILGKQEAEIGRGFESVERIATELAKTGNPGFQTRDLLKNIGVVLLREYTMVARAEVTEKPEQIWEFPQLDKVHTSVAEEFELVKRQSVLERKFTLISKTAEITLDVLQNRHSMKIEWYIVILIVMEVLLEIYALFIKDIIH